LGKEMAISRQGFSYYMQGEWSEGKGSTSSHHPGRMKSMKKYKRDMKDNAGEEKARRCGMQVSSHMVE